MRGSGLYKINHVFPQPCNYNPAYSMQQNKVKLPDQDPVNNRHGPMASTGRSHGRSWNILPSPPPLANSLMMTQCLRRTYRAQ